MGDADATNVNAMLMGLNPAEWISPSATSFPDKTIGTLMKAIPADNVPGDQFTDEWSYNAPLVSVPTAAYHPEIRVSYSYQTDAAATMRFVTNDYIKSLKTSEQDAARKNSGLISSQSSGAPIKVTFTAGTRPFIVYSSGSANPSQFSFQITMTNVGPGNLYDPGRDSGKISSTSTGWLTISRPDIVGSNVNINCPSLETSNLAVKLTKGESKTVSCTVSASGINGILDGNINVTLKYNYYVDGSTSFSILKQA
jgi:hypothetical protein